MDHDHRDKYEQLFNLIVEQSLSMTCGAPRIDRFPLPGGRDPCIGIRIGRQLSPARIRYRQFLTVVKQLMDRNISERAFIDEFKGWQDVAGRLDFGIYGFCLDSLFRNSGTDLG